MKPLTREPKGQDYVVIPWTRDEDGLHLYKIVGQDDLWYADEVVDLSLSTGVPIAINWMP